MNNVDNWSDPYGYEENTMAVGVEKMLKVGWPMLMKATWMPME